MPEITEVTKYVDELKKFINKRKLVSVEVLGGKYYSYHIKDKNGNYINKIKNKETGRMRNIKPETHTGGKYIITLDNLDDLNAELPLYFFDVCSKGKFLYIELGGSKSSDWFIGFTFGMTGMFKYDENNDENNDNNYHVKFTLDNDKSFYFYDPRQFGTIMLSDNPKLLKQKLASLGVDMLTDKNVSLDDFIEKFRKISLEDKNICQVLMSQKIISGIGNYLKSEILYASAINPFKTIGKLNDVDLERLYYSIIDILYQETNDNTHTRQHLKVYQQKQDPYGNKVIIIPDNESPDKRTTYYVPAIQGLS